MSSGMYGNGVALTERVLDLLWGRQNLTLNNIANVDTPGFKSEFMTFENELARRISNEQYSGNVRRDTKRVIDTQRGRFHITVNESARLDENNVDMDQEQVELVKTAYEYQYMVNSVSNDLKRLTAAVKSF